METTHRGAASIKAHCSEHTPTDLPDRLSRPTFPTDIPDPPGEPTHQHTRRGHARLHSQHRELTNALLLETNILSGVVLRKLAESILRCRKFRVSEMFGLVPPVPALDFIPGAPCAGDVALTTNITRVQCDAGVFPCSTRLGRLDGRRRGRRGRQVLGGRLGQKHLLGNRPDVLVTVSAIKPLSN